MKDKSPKLLERLKEYPLLYNALIILLVLLHLAIFSHILMLIGTRHGARRTVPTLTGIPLAEAEDLAREHDLELIVNDSLFVTIYEGGVVLDQLPEVGVEVKPGRKVYVTINSFSQKMVSLPYVAGRSLRQAKNMLEIAGLEIDKLIYRADMATNYVLEERYRGELISPDSKRMAEAGSGVTLYVGVENGSGVATVPQVVGLSLREAKSRLWENGFNVGKIEYDEGIDLLTQKDARVYIQTPMLGQVLQLGTTISLRLTLDEEKLTKSRAEASALAAKIAKEQLELEKQRNETPTDEEATDIPTEEEPEEEYSQEEIDQFFQ